MLRALQRKGPWQRRTEVQPRQALFVRRRSVPESQTLRHDPGRAIHRAIHAFGGDDGPVIGPRSFLIPGVGFFFAFTLRQWTIRRGGAGKGRNHAAGAGQ